MIGRSNIVLDEILVPSSSDDLRELLMSAMISENLAKLKYSQYIKSSHQIELLVKDHTNPLKIMTC